MAGNTRLHARIYTEMKKKEATDRHRIKNSICIIRKNWICRLIELKREIVEFLDQLKAETAWCSSSPWAYAIKWVWKTWIEKTTIENKFEFNKFDERMIVIVGENSILDKTEYNRIKKNLNIKYYTPRNEMSNGSSVSYTQSC